MFQSLSKEDRELQIQMGLDTAGQGSSFLARSISSFNPRDQTVQAGSSHTHIEVNALYTLQQAAFSFKPKVQTVRRRPKQGMSSCALQQL